MPESRKQPLSKYTADRNIPGAFEGETVTRRRLMTLTVARRRRRRHGRGRCCPRSASPPARRIFERAPVIWTPVGKPEDFPDDDYLPRVITTTQGIGEVGKTTVYVRRAQPGDRRRRGHPAPPATDAPVVAISSRCMHLGLPGALDVGRRSASSARATAASTASRARSSGGPPVRPLDHFYTRMRNGQVEVGPRYSVNSEFKRFPSYRDPGQPLDGIGQYLYPGRFSTPKNP